MIDGSRVASAHGQNVPLRIPASRRTLDQSQRNQFGADEGGFKGLFKRHSAMQLRSADGSFPNCGNPFPDCRWIFSNLGKPISTLPAGLPQMAEGHLQVAEGYFPIGEDPFPSCRRVFPIWRKGISNVPKGSGNLAKTLFQL